MLRFLVRHRKALLTLAVLSALAMAFAGFANYRILTRHTARLYTDITQVPSRDIALVLGANPVTASGAGNLHFAYRIEAAAALYHAKKVHHLIVSGDNHRADYDEPTAMKNALVARGVPATAITCDYAGFRTLDSVVRAKRVFGASEITIVSQRYHNTRALEIAEAHGLDAIAFCSRDVPARYAVRSEAREIAARTVTLLDLYVWGRGPRFGGPYEPIQLARR